jgi:hypothetical protein
MLLRNWVASNLVNFTYGFGASPFPPSRSGLGYTLYSEWINVEVRHTWAYSKLTPTLPPLATGLSPGAESIIIPALVFVVIRRALYTKRGSHWRRHLSIKAAMAQLSSPVQSSG